VRVYNAAIVTKIEPDKEFFAAEDYHQDFLTRHPSHPYIVYNDLPKIDDLKRLFPRVADLAEWMLTNAANGERHAGRLRIQAIADVMQRITVAR
jgi:peptide-methionine (S)-S-oxide reductase